MMNAFAFCILLITGICNTKTFQKSTSEAVHADWTVDKLQCYPETKCETNDSSEVGGPGIEIVTLSTDSDPSSLSYGVQDREQWHILSEWKLRDHVWVTPVDSNHKCSSWFDNSILHNDRTQQWICASYEDGGKGKIANVRYIYDKYMARGSISIYLQEVEPFGGDSHYVVEDANAMNTARNSWHIGDILFALRGDSGHHCQDAASEVLINGRTKEWICSFFQYK